MSSLNVHHLGNRHTARNPFFRRPGQVGNLGKITIVAILDQHERIVAERIAIVGIKIGRECTSSLIAKEMRLDCVLARISSRRFSCFQLIAYKS